MKICRFGGDHTLNALCAFMPSGAHGSFHVFSDRVFKYVLTPVLRSTSVLIRFLAIQGPRHIMDAVCDVCGSVKTRVTDPALIRKLEEQHSGQMKHRLRQIPLVIGMPVAINQNFDVPAGVVNGSYGVLRKIRYFTDSDGQ